MSNIYELTDEKEYLNAYNILVQLRTDITKESYLYLLKEMKKDGYMLFGLYKDKELVSLVGFSLRVNFYNKRHVFVYDLVTDIKYRSLGYGEELLNFVDKWAKENNTEYVALESGIQRVEAHKFYEKKLSYIKWCFSFRKKI